MRDKQAGQVLNKIGERAIILSERSCAMSVITISREFGSEGDDIARQAAETLGYHLVDKEFIGIILGQYGYVEFDKEYSALPTFWERFDAQREKQREVMVNMLNQVIKAVAHHGDVVILGRSGFEVLSGFGDVFHVRIQAPFSVRVGRVMEQQKITFEEAESIVQKNDKVRLEFIGEFYKVPWGTIQSFDLIINTDKVSPGLAAIWVTDAAKAFTPSHEANKSMTACIKVDRILADTVSNVLECNQTHR
jgi:cytidylate kinase